MAADTRPFKSKEQDGQGNEVIIRDQQLVEQASQTTMASGEYFEIVDVDGRMAKIPKANMMSVVLEAIRLLLDDSGSNISAANLTKILGLSASSIGNILPTDLASVLGDKGLMKGELTSGNINYIEFGVYNLRPEDSSSSLVNCPSSFNGTLIAFRPLGTYYVVQLYFASDKDKTVYYRLKTSDWWGWRRIQSVAV